MNKLCKTGVAGVLALSCLTAYAVPISATDAFTGAAIGLTTLGVANASSSFDGSDIDPANVTFFPDVGAGNTGFMNFSTALITLSGIRLYAANDGSGNGFRRSMSTFRFFADTDNNGSYETPLVIQAINPDYNVGQPGDVDLAPNELEMTFIFGSSISASNWRYEVVQGVNFGIFDGVRVQELDAITAVPAPASLALLGLGLAGLGFSRRKSSS